jgi:hypothetical protein
MRFAGATHGLKQEAVSSITWDQRRPARSSFQYQFPRKQFQTRHAAGLAMALQTVLAKNANRTLGWGLRTSPSQTRDGRKNEQGWNWESMTKTGCDDSHIGQPEAKP